MTKKTRVGAFERSIIEAQQAQQAPPSDLQPGETAKQYNARKRETAKNFERISKLGIDANLSDEEAPPLVPQQPWGPVIDDDGYLAKLKFLTDAERAKRAAKAEIEAAAEAERTAAAAAVVTTRRTAAMALSQDASAALDQAYRILKEYVDMKEHEHIAVALWCLHTHVFDRFTHTPRLALMSPEPGGGKSTTFDIINQFCARSEISGNITGPSLFRTIDETGGTLLLDEGDNLNWDDKSLRAVINDGHQPGRPIKRTLNNEVRIFNTFSPMGLAAIGRFPVPLMRRAVIISMAPPLPGVAVKLKKFNAATRFDGTWLAITDWAESAQLDLDPALPPGTINRIADNWRPLISIADSFSPEWGALARKSALTFQSLTNASVAILLLYDIRSIFNKNGVDLIGSESLVRNLTELEDSWTWSAYQGVGDDKASRKLTTGEVSRLLRPFGITPKSIWAAGPRLAGASSFKGYRRAWFEDTWARYCPEPSAIAAASRPTSQPEEVLPPGDWETT